MVYRSVPFGRGLRRRAEAKPSQVCRLPAQHQPTFAAPRRAAPSRPVPPLIQIAGVRASSPTPLGLRDPTVMKHPCMTRIWAAGGFDDEYPGTAWQLGLQWLLDGVEQLVAGTR